MGILPDHEILKEMRLGRLGISDFSDRSLTPNGYDLRIAEIAVDGETHRFGTVIVPPGTMFHVSTIENVSFPNDICGQLWLRTTWLRRGIMAGFGKIDAGFNGTLTLAAYNISKEAVELPIGGRFAQMCFERLSSPAEFTYERRSGNYQGQRGVTLESLKQ